MALPAPTGMYVRQDINQLAPNTTWDPYTLAYAKAVGAMQELWESDPADPRAWTFQAFMHGFPPEIKNPDSLWGGCQHGSWYFLPWHRMFVYMFERIVRSFVVEQGGPQDWALPFWNWTANPALPLAFRQDELPDGSPNPLYVADHRNPNPAPGINGGAPLPPDVVETDYAMSFRYFSTGNELAPPIPEDPSPGEVDIGFGGKAVPPGHYQSYFGGLEDLPHNHIHDLVGGPSNVDNCGQGWMCDPNCAALDPIFWLHHSNIDRLWVVWMTQGGQNPTDAAWTGQEFSFYDSDGEQYTGACGDVVTTPPLGYTYSYPSIAASPPEVLGVAPPTPRRAPAARAPEPAGVGGSSNTELGASTEPVALGGRPSSVDVPLAGEAEGAVRTLREPRASRQSIYLTLEDVTLDAHPGVVYAVYLNKPDDVRGAQARTYRAGLLSFFGLMHSHGEGHEGHAAPTSAYDVTSVVAHLESRGDWDPSKARVTFEPLGLQPEGGGSGYEAAADYLPDEPRVEVGRVCLRAR